MTSPRERRITNELSNINKIHPGGCSVELIDNNLGTWRVILPGPAGSPYEGKNLYINFVFPKEYPFKAPDIGFSPVIFHPNVDANSGEFCIGKYTANTKMAAILDTAIEILKTPNPSNFLNDVAAKLYTTNPEEFKKKAASLCK